MEVVFLNAEYDIIIDGSNLINHSEKDFSGPFHWVATVLAHCIPFNLVLEVGRVIG
jgi:hypothetical protein